MLYLILLLSVLLRVLAAIYLGNTVVALPGTFDQVSYHALALRVLGGHGFSFGEAWWPMTAANEPTAHWSFLYTFYLTAVYRTLGTNPLAARLIQAIAVGVLQPLLAFHLARQLFRKDGSPSRLSEWVPLAAAGITAVYIYFIYYSAALMTEPFFIIGLMGALLLTIRLEHAEAGSRTWKTALALGITLGLTVLLRQLILLIVPFLFLWILASNLKRRSLRPAVAAVFISTAILIVSIVPFTLYNYARFDRFVLLNTNAGYVVYWANHPVYGDRFLDANEMGDNYQELVPDELRGLDEAALDSELLKLGLGFIGDDPVRFIKLSLSRVPIYFKFWPESESGNLSNLSRVGSFGLFLPFMIYGLFRSLIMIVSRTDHRLATGRVVLLYGFMVTYAAIHILSWTQIRYRLPVDAVLVIFGALGLVEVAFLLLKLGSRFRIDLNDDSTPENEKRAST